MGKQSSGDIDIFTGRASVMVSTARGDCEVYAIASFGLRRILNEIR